MPKLVDLTNCQIGDIYIIERDMETQKEKGSTEAFWKCRCDRCGTYFSARGRDIRNGKIKSCGCLRKENARNINYKNLTNQRFGKLTVLYEKKDIRKDNHCVWHCICDCGNEIDVESKFLLNDTTKSCGCLKSNGELKIIQILQSLNIEFEMQKSFSDCKNINVLKFDFYLPKYNLCIEYNGIQHYQAIDYFGGEERFKQQQKLDTIKQQWCTENNIKLIIIPYLDFSILNQEYILNILDKQ